MISIDRDREREWEWQNGSERTSERRSIYVRWPLYTRRVVFFPFGSHKMHNIYLRGKAMRKTFYGRSSAHTLATYFFYSIAAFHHVLFIRIHSMKITHPAQYTVSLSRSVLLDWICVSCFYLCLRFDELYTFSWM